MDTVSLSFDHAASRIPLPSCTMGITNVTSVQPKDMYIGDPPAGTPFPGTTWIPGLVQPAALPYGLPWDPTDPVVVPCVPYAPYVPQVPYEVMPNLPWPPTATTFVLQPPSPWNVTFHADRLVARCDVPGAVIEGLVVEVVHGLIEVSYRRFDTGSTCKAVSQPISDDYDPTTAEGVLQSGVLTVQRHLERLSHRVTVTVR